jgi:hypothetical protein
VWHIAPDQAMKNDSFTAIVTRLGCSGGSTGEVLAPVIDLRRNEIVVTFFVAALPEGFHTCEGNNGVPYVVSVGEAIGGRSLVDGSCLGGEPTQTTFCAGGSTRWQP